MEIDSHVAVYTELNLAFPVSRLANPTPTLARDNVTATISSHKVKRKKENPFLLRSRAVPPFNVPPCISPHQAAVPKCQKGFQRLLLLLLLSVSGESRNFSPRDFWRASLAGVRHPKNAKARADKKYFLEAAPRRYFEKVLLFFTIFFVSGILFLLLSRKLVKLWAMSGRWELTPIFLFLRWRRGQESLSSFLFYRAFMPWTDDG